MSERVTGEEREEEKERMKEERRAIEEENERTEQREREKGDGRDLRVEAGPVCAVSERECVCAMCAM
jgi:hypothetical protein